MARNIDTFEAKLGSMIKSIQKSENLFEKEIKTIADNIAASIYSEDYELDKELLEALCNCKEYARTRDAADHLCKYIFHNEDCKSLKAKVSIKTIDNQWNRNYGVFRDKIEDIFISEGLDTEKGFVYVFWSAASLKYFYVGKTKADSLKRLKDRWHGNAAVSSENATKLTIIYPYRSNDIETVEASIIRIIGTDYLEYNAKEEPFKEGNSELSIRISEIEKFLRNLIKIF